MAVADSLCPGCFTDKGRSNPPARTAATTSASAPPWPCRTAPSDGQFLIGRVLGKPGGFGITYLGWDHSETRVAIKEYLPRDLAGRAADGAPSPPTPTRRRPVPLRAGPVPAGGPHPGPDRPPQHRAGAPLLRGQRHRLPGDGLLTTAVPCRTPGAAGGRCPRRRPWHHDADPGRPAGVHARASCTATSSPRTSTSPTAAGPSCSTSAPPARPWASAAASRWSSPRVMPPSSSPPQGRAGPRTDIYACAATLYTLVTGRTPPDALEREKDDSLPAPRTVRSGLSPAFSAALVKAMSTDPHHRPASVEEFQALLRSRSAAPETESLAETVQFHRAGPSGNAVCCETGSDHRGPPRAADPRAASRRRGGRPGGAAGDGGGGDGDLPGKPARRERRPTSRGRGPGRRRPRVHSHSPGAGRRPAAGGAG